MVATIPIEVFSAANDGRSHGGRYKGFCNYLLKTSRGVGKIFPSDIKPFMLNDNRI